MVTTPGSARLSRPQRTRRNTAVFAATGATFGLLMLYPTSTNAGHRTGALAVAGISSTSTAASTVVNGRSIDTRYGPVQVRLTVSNGRIVSATAIDFPNSDGHDSEINAVAIPLLQNETVTAQNASIDTVSGATYTSDGYRQSLQSALDAAHLA